MVVPAVTVPTLYHIGWFSSSIPYQVLLELGVPESKFGIKKITGEELKTIDYIEELSPRRVCPFMQFPDGSALVESAAIMMYILENFDSTNKLYPPIGHENRARFWQGVIFAVAEGYKTVIAVFFLCYNIKKKERDQEKLKPVKEKFEKDVMGHLEKEIKGDYYLGDEFSAADVAMGYVLMTAEYCNEELIPLTGRVRDYFNRLQERETYKKLYLPENVV